MTAVTKPADYLYLLQRAWDLFPGAIIDLEYGDDETVHILVNDHRFTFEIGSDDDCYAFSDGEMSFVIPLMENPEDI